MNEENKANLKLIIIMIVILITLKICLIFLWPFVVAIILALAIEPSVKHLIGAGFKRKTSSIIVITIFILVSLFLVFYLSKYIYEQIVSFLSELPNIAALLKEKIPILKDKDLDYINRIMSIKNIIDSYKDKIFKQILSASNKILYIFIMIISTILISIDLDNIELFIKKYTPNTFYKVFINVSKKFSDMLNLEIKLTAASTVQTILGLYILGFNRPLTIGLICGILDILPVVGTAMVFIPMIIFELASGRILLSAGLICLYLLLQASRKIMEVKFVGSSLKINPLITLISIYAGIKIYGAWGIIFGPIVVILFKELYNVIIAKCELPTT